MADDKNNAAAKPVEVEAISTPKGGGAYQGLAGIAGVDCFTGAGTAQIPLYATPCRGIEPKLALEYSTTSGNGPFGMGFSLPIPAISRKTTEMIPRYDDDADIFVLQGGEELAAQSAERKGGETVRVYLRQRESEFERIEYHKSASESFWLIYGRDNSLSRFGESPDSRIANPRGGDEVFSWLLSSWTDEKGNRIQYSYTPAGSPLLVRYGNYPGADAECFCFEMRFEYEKGRGDAFTVCNAGFERETHELCRSVSMWHLFGIPVKMRETSIHYESGGRSRISLLTRVSTVCYLGDDQAALPDLDLSYTAFAFERERPEWAPLRQDHTIPFEIDNGSFHFVDLDGEGAAGILYADSRSCLYAAPLGDFTYAAPAALPDFPAHRDLLRYSLTDIDGDGRYQLAVYTAAESGYYRRENGSWSPFIPFEQVDTERSQYAERADLQGDHRQHKLVVENRSLRYYPTLRGKGGAGEPVEREVPEGFPHSRGNSHSVLTRFVEIAGDGLAHRVLIENGSVSYFLNLGYGHFGRRVLMENAPYIEGGLDTSRLFFADLDGSGAADLIYAYPDRIAVYLNRVGKAFAAPVSVPLPEAYTSGDAFHAANLFGNGTDALILTKLDARGIRHYCLDFTKGTKPYLLTGIDGNTGMREELAHRSSSSFYFQAKAAGKAWRRPLHFPVQVIAGKRVTDDISETVTVTDYGYTDALYDFRRCEFRGFRAVEVCESLYGPGYVEPRSVRTKKIWHFSAAGDEPSPLMATHIIEVDDHDEGERSLWGRPVRQETYESGELCEVREYRYKTAQAGRGAYFPYQLEALTRTTERSPSDPRMEHDLTLEVDSWGNEVRKCVVAYPRCDTAGLPKRLVSAQSALSVKETRRAYSNMAEGGVWRLGVLAEEAAYEYGGLPRPAHIFSVETLLPLLDTAFANRVEYGGSFRGVLSARLLSLRRLAYWDDAQEAALPYGKAGAAALLRHTEEAVFPGGFQPLANVLTKPDIEAAGYFLDESGGYFWKRSPVRLYGQKEQFFLPSGLGSDSLFLRAEWEYDPYLLLCVRSLAYIDRDTYNETAAEIDYAAMGYRLIRDPNGAVTETRFHPLGLPEVITEHKQSPGGGREGNGDLAGYRPLPRDFDAVTDDPGGYLQEMSAYTLYEPRAWQDHGQPVRVVSLARGNDISSGMDGRIGVTVEYLDAFGNMAETRRLAERGNWAVPSKAAFDGTQHKIAEYQSFFADTPHWIAGRRASIPPVVKRYDWKGRLIRKETPEELAEGAGYASFFATTEYGAWEEREYDENRNATDSPYYKTFMALPSPGEDRLDSLKKSECFCDLPVTRYLDPFGRKTAESLDGRFSYFERDAGGNVTGFADARRTAGCNRVTVYDMTGATISVRSDDAGETIRLDTVFGGVAYSIDGDSPRKAYIYDGLMRLTEVRAAGLGMAQRIEYGEAREDSLEHGLRGRIFRHFDQAGVMTIAAYDLRGNPLERERRFAQDGARFLDWGADIPLEGAAYKERIAYSADGSPTEVTGPDGVTLLRHYNRRGYLDRVQAQIRGGIVPLIDAIYYCAGEKKTKILYANGAYTKNRYSAFTALLEQTVTAAPDKTLRTYSYTYDPAGHITRIRDTAGLPTFTRGQVAQPYQDYVYDVFYRLETTSGRELSGKANDLASLTPYMRGYSYDDGGNLLAVRHVGAAGRYTVSMEIDPVSNRIVSATRCGDTWPMEYDGCGNPLMLPNLRDMRWDYEGRLAGAAVVARECGGDDEEAYLYDHAGNRARKLTRRLTAGGMAETRKSYLGAFSLSVSSGGEERILCVTDGGTPLVTLRFDGADAAPKVSYQVADHTESVVLEMDESANLICSREYFPFGEVALELAGKLTARQQGYLFAGKERDITGLYYFETRYYSSYLRRFISPDAFGNTKPEEGGSYHQYAYCHCDPVNHLDLDGRCERPWNTRDHPTVCYFNSDDSDSAESSKKKRKLSEDDRAYGSTGGGPNFHKILVDAVGGPPADMEKPHAHHIVQKGDFSSEPEKRMTLQIDRAILKSYGVDFLVDPSNLMWAPNKAGTHSADHVREVHCRLKMYRDSNPPGGNNAAFRVELQQIGAGVYLN